jgi:16S rRNA (cytosine967-C5)-methyltransferase
MKPGAHIVAVVELIQELGITAKPADKLLAHFFRDRTYIGSKDRHRISEIFFNLLRTLRKWDSLMERIGFTKTSRLRVYLYLLHEESMSIEEIEALGEEEKYGPRPLTDQERVCLQKSLIIINQLSEEELLSIPAPLYKSLKTAFGESLKEEMLALNQPAPLFLRVNLLKTTCEAVCQQLDKEEIPYEKTLWSPWGIKISKKYNFLSHPLYKEGMIEIQDEGSQLIALLCEAQPGQNVMDYCAGAGGKTLALAMTMQNKGKLIACDVMEGRLIRSKERLKRAGAHNIELKLLDSEKWLKRQEGRMDRVLVDAPCSGTGTWRRNPDLKWKIGPKEVQELVTIQRNILQKASKLVKVKGRLIYATCSVLLEENERQIESFLKEHPNFELLYAPSIGNHLMSKDLPMTSPYLKLTPASHGTDGFFTAILERKE